MGASTRAVRSLGAGAFALLMGCDRMGPALFLSARDRDIASATRTIETAGDDAVRAAGHSSRARAYSEKARYGRFMKRIPLPEYTRLFDLALADHDRAIALEPGNAESYFGRGWTYHDRASLEDPKEARRWFELAAADFTRAVEKDPKHDLAWDRLGLVRQATGELDEAIDAYRREMSLKPLGRSRLADLHCDRGSSLLREKKVEAAIADLEKSIEYGVSADGCSCEPYNPLLALYTNETRQYDKAWALVGEAAKRGKWLAPELLESLRKSSGRSS